MPLKKKLLLSIILILVLIEIIFYIILAKESIWLRILPLIIVILGTFFSKDVLKNK